ncbi:MAG: hypothetical protein SAK29_23835 [Scytonema sp. PMC 1069.18]|nr:hypothetical protein [Scytonema sp. PMC 1069.18]MEC4884659.1 hypothetical protein [Scytonema sp. PMC 1070.18]
MPYISSIERIGRLEKAKGLIQSRSLELGFEGRVELAIKQSAMIEN